MIVRLLTLGANASNDDRNYTLCSLTDYLYTRIFRDRANASLGLGLWQSMLLDSTNAAAINADWLCTYYDL